MSCKKAVDIGQSQVYPLTDDIWFQYISTFRWLSVVMGTKEFLLESNLFFCYLPDDVPVNCY